MSAAAHFFNCRAVKPLECLDAGWRLVRDRYWLFLGVTLVGVLLGSLAPMALLLGPTMCGIYLCLPRQADGRRVTFEMLFEGFNHFVQSLIAALIMSVPTILLLVPSYFLFMLGLAGLATAQPRAGPPDLSLVWGFVGLFLLVVLAIFVLSIVVGALFLFTFPLIVDRNLSGAEAVLLSIRAVWGNLGGVLGLIVLTALLSFAGTLACCIGTYFVLPISFAAQPVACRQVFPKDEPPEVIALERQ